MHQPAPEALSTNQGIWVCERELAVVNELSARQVLGLCLLDLRGQLELAVCYFRLAELAASMKLAGSSG